MGNICRHTRNDCRFMSNTLPAMDLLFPQSRQRALAALLLAPGESFHLRELGRLTGIHAGTLLRELEKLETVGLVLRREQGNQRRFEANPAHPLFADLASMFRKTHGVAAQLREALAPLGSDVTLAAIFGSVARGEQAAGSDVDLLVVGTVDFASLVTALGTVQAAVGREINPVLYSPDNFKDRASLRSGFVNNVLHRPMVFVKGDRRELEELVADQATAGTRS